MADLRRLAVALAFVVASIVGVPSDAGAVTETGALISYADGSGIHVMDEFGGSRRTVVPSDQTTVRVGSPEISPDGTELVYARTEDACEGGRFARRSIWIVGIDGSRAREVPGSADGHSPRWSPDGDRIVYARTAGPCTFAPRDVVSSTRFGALFRVVAVDAESPSWSPDGSMLAFVGHLTDRNGVRQSSIDVARVDGTGRRRVIDFDHIVTDSLSNPEWSPDGQHLYYEYSDRYSPEHIEGVNLDGSGHRLIMWSRSFFSLSPDGHHFITAVHDRYLAVVDHAGNEVRDLGLPIQVNARWQPRPPSACRGGYWLVASDGGVFTFGDAAFHGSTGAIRLNSPIVGMAATPEGDGYWLVAADGGMFAFGAARFFGSTGDIRLNSPIVGMAATPDGDGYWLVAADGGIFAFGAATFHGSAGDIQLNSPIKSMAATADGNGYWLVASDGGVFSYGQSATFRGAAAPTMPGVPVVASATAGSGYDAVDANGQLYPRGDGDFCGSLFGRPLTRPAVGFARRP